MTDWLLYGAYGYTGRLIAQAAVERGERPVLAGRDGERTRALAADLGLESRVFPMDNPAALRDALSHVDAVLHAAGPFVHTWRAMADACIDCCAHYLDITGEIAVFEGLHGLDARARDAGIALLPGVGFDVVPTDCAAALAVRDLPDSDRLEIAFHGTGGLSRGTARSMLEGIEHPAMERRGGRIVPIEDQASREIPFADRPRHAVAISWGDVSTAYHSTGVDNIRTYATAPPRQARVLRAISTLRPVLKGARVRNALRWWVDQALDGPDEKTLTEGSSRVWVRATSSESGRESVVELTCPNAYLLTARSAVEAVRQLLRGTGERRGTGFLTPSLAFGAEFAEGLEGVERVR